MKRVLTVVALLLAVVAGLAFADATISIRDAETRVNGTWVGRRSLADGGVVFDCEGRCLWRGIGGDVRHYGASTFNGCKNFLDTACTADFVRAVVLDGGAP